MTDSLKLTRRSHLRDILALAVPAMLAQTSLPLLNIGETSMTGRLSAEALAARAVGAGLLFAVSFALAWTTIVELFTANTAVIALLSPGVMILLCLIQLSTASSLSLRAY